MVITWLRTWNLQNQNLQNHVINVFLQCNLLLHVVHENNWNLSKAILWGLLWGFSGDFSKDFIEDFLVNFLEMNQNHDNSFTPSDPIQFQCTHKGFIYQRARIFCVFRIIFRPQNYLFFSGVKIIYPSGIHNVPQILKNHTINPTKIKPVQLKPNYSKKQRFFIIVFTYLR